MKISDAHTDFLTEIKDKAERENYVKGIKKIAGRISCAVFTTNSTLTVKDVENFKVELEDYNKKFNTEFLLSIEDLGFIKTDEDLKKLIELKPFSVTLTWNCENQFAGGAHTNKGLTQLGIETIHLLEKNKILIDTAHLSRRSFNQFAKITSKPMYNSHSNIFSLHKHRRNLTDSQIKKIVDSNGFIGLTIYEKFISNKQITAEDVALQFDYLIKKFGCDHFGFGTDLFGIENKYLPQNFKSYLDAKTLVKEFRKIMFFCSFKIFHSKFFNYLFS